MDKTFASFIGPARDRLLSRRRSPLTVGRMICTTCTRQLRGRFQPVVKCRVLTDGVERPGVMCPRCGLAWIEQEEQPEGAA